MAQLTLRQLREFGLTPDTNLGQHFLVDDNVLGVIERMAGVGANDVAWEPGPGVGVLTDRLARLVACVHAVELDRRLEPALTAATADLPNVQVHWGDALALGTAALEPAPTALVSNLPYHVAAPIVAEALRLAPGIRRFCVMVQKEVGDRFFTRVGAKDYGALSVLVQATCTRTATHKVARTVFAPPPHVDSVLVAFTRDLDLVPDDRVDDFARFVRGCFAHRRKTLSNNLGSIGVPRERALPLLEELGLKPAVRPQELTPAQFAQLHRLVEAQR
jgi:16S rRNA (adenine1518-N6/adenine1519-N6)-dimethyltransferase